MADGWTELIDAPNLIVTNLDKRTGNNVEMRRFFWRSSLALLPGDTATLPGFLFTKTFPPEFGGRLPIHLVARAKDVDSVPVWFLLVFARNPHGSSDILFPQIVSPRDTKEITNGFFGIPLAKETPPTPSQAFSLAPQPVPQSGIKVEQPEDPYSGVLEPANDPMPKDISDFWLSTVGVSFLPSNGVFLFAGKSVFGMRQSKSMCAFTHKRECVLRLEQQENGGPVFISENFFDEDGRLIAELSSNRFNVALPPTTFRVLRPNKSTLIVRDGRGKEVLNLKYLNPSAFEITCDFRLADKTRFAVTPEYIEAGGVRFESISMGVSGSPDRAAFADF